MARLDPVVGSEQGGYRPVLIVQNDRGNRRAPTVIAVPLTASTRKPPLPTHVRLEAGEGGLRQPSHRAVRAASHVGKNKAGPAAGQTFIETNGKRGGSPAPFAGYASLRHFAGRKRGIKPMKHWFTKERITAWGQILLGCLVGAMAYPWFLVPNHIAPAA